VDPHTWLAGKNRIELVQGDITTQRIDAIVNAANSTLLGGGGVDGAIHRAGGPSILAECRTLGGCETGDAKITTAGELSAKHVIHTVGPVYCDGTANESGLLERCHRRSIALAEEHALESLAFPAISCGVYGYPMEEAAPLALRTVQDALSGTTTVRLVRFVLFSREDYAVFEAALQT